MSARLAGSTVEGIFARGLADAVIFAWITGRPEGFADVLKADAVANGSDQTMTVAGVAALATATLTVVGVIWTRG